MKSLSMKVLVLSLSAITIVFVGIALADWGGGSYGGGGYGGGESGGPWTPTSDIGKRHIDMVSFGDCTGCHQAPTGTYDQGPLAPPDLSRFEYVNMGDNRPCSRCHGNNIFTAAMGANRCGDCHSVGGSGYHR
jgi:hypothetical protein